MSIIEKTAGTTDRRLSTAQKASVVQELRGLLGTRNVLSTPYDLTLYEYDASIERGKPDIVVLPSSTEEVAAIVRLAARYQIPVVPRGAGTGLSGGAVPIQGGIVISFARMNRILEIDIPNLRAVVQPGLVNLHLSNALLPQGFYYVPDPSSQRSCTLGGNVGENAGGPHTLLYGVTTNHVTGLEIVTAEGEVIEVGGMTCDTPGYDLTGLLIGSEGTLCIVTKIIVRIVPVPESVKTMIAVFNTMDDASNTVSEIIASGVIPAALEMMDHMILQAVEADTHAGYPMDAAAVLLIEAEGLKESVTEQVEQIVAISKKHHARLIRIAANETERQLLWAGRKNAFGAVGRISPEFYVQDGVVPRTKLPYVLRRIQEICDRYDLKVGNVFHAGDGNLHPLILFDSQKPGEVERVRQAGHEILAVCAEVGGSITGEHGVGLEKQAEMALIFSDVDLHVMQQVRAAWNPNELFNPGKLFPLPGRCADIRHLSSYESKQTSRKG
ncbi:glycolate oxidase [Thermosporothrix hazakensis]|jgi:glycolate oxidase|uniref:Glycolate oxidase n=1 Tax=Thermosporothrix hazakensis TaxID=644383 RepID=A0A326UE74_THEHA|nr:FAD-linked oxidase C-terminal domain-containing protein [Thermosporothrix hazakensis]PZW24822.1 glycolate oxidase [Thermosporothrix hazakensis]GCE46488.1 FAD-binding protein [Thermosporothrix hazakensis]